jgi:hypothetical protein
MDALCSSGSQKGNKNSLYTKESKKLSTLYFFFQFIYTNVISPDQIYEDMVFQ